MRAEWGTRQASAPGGGPSPSLPSDTSAPTASVISSSQRVGGGKMKSNLTFLIKRRSTLQINFDSHNYLL